ncbi:GDP-mannose 4,6-dehydratase [bacterium]|jgi:GDPmannose 4,6-dehydratase|nr:GDP-mannose 4,6-dehydratase [bacterium]
MKAFITGITGQDGSYLAELLLNKGYEVHGIIRRTSNFPTTRIDHIHKDLNLYYGDVTDSSCLSRIIRKILPDEIYNLAAQSHVKVSFQEPVYTSNSVSIGTLNILEIVRDIKEDLNKSIKFYQASSSEMFGKVQETPQKETTPFYPRSPYGVAKLYGHWITINYRESYDIFGCNGILFNHESPRRGETFVTRKITRAATRIKLGLQDKLLLGNLDAQRDWGYAKDYVEAMWTMLQQNNADDYIISTGETHSVREFCEIAFNSLDLNYNDYVSVDPIYYRPSEVDLLLGDSSKAQSVLGWQPNTSFNDLIKIMIENDLQLAEKEKFYASR